MAARRPANPTKRFGQNSPPSRSTVTASSATTDKSQRVRTMCVSAAPELARTAAAGGVHKLARMLDPAAGGGGPVRRLLDALVANQPAAYLVATLDGHLDLRLLSRPLEDI